MDLGIAIIISALVGAKLLLVVVEFDHFRQDPSEIWTVVRSGGVVLRRAHPVRCGGVLVHSSPRASDLEHL